MRMRWRAAVVRGLSSPFAPALAYGLLASIITPWWSLYVFDFDEGINLGKARLVASGYGPYGDLWNDQPPLMTYVLAMIEGLTPGAIAGPRGFVLASAMLLLGSVFAIVRHAAADGARGGGGVAAWAAVVLLACHYQFLRLSVAVMIGLPAIALATFALALVLTTRRPEYARFIGAGVAYGLSLQIKFFVLAAAPALLVATLLAGGRAAGWRPRLVNVALTAGAALAAFAAIALVSEQPFARQIVSTHVSNELRQDFYFRPELYALLDKMSHDVFLVFFGALGIVLALAQRSNRIALAFLAWFAVGFVALWLHTPKWVHHILLLATPLSVLAGLFIGWAAQRLDALAADRARLGAMAALGLLAAIALVSITELKKSEEKPPVIAKIKELGGSWIITDLPITAYYSRILPAPETVVTSLKRRRIGQLSSSVYIETIERRVPRQIWFIRFAADPPLLSYLEDAYDKQTFNGATLFVRRPAPPAAD